MTSLEMIHRLWRHDAWADARLVRALREQGAGDPVVRELAHVVGAREVWLSRLEGREARLPVWPAADLAELEGEVEVTHEALGAYVAKLDESGLTGSATYANSRGQRFSTPVGEILLHQFLHGQYHRGKVNDGLRKAGLEPVPVDFIAFVRAGASGAR